VVSIPLRYPCGSSTSDKVSFENIVYRGDGFNSWTISFH
jgi:hypothetical protein